MDKTTEKLNKLSLPATILIASIILGGFYFASQVNKQRSIERQQQIKLQENRRIEEVRAKQEYKEYIAKRKADCLAIYKTESDKWSNVVSWNYNHPDSTLFKLNNKDFEKEPAKSQKKLDLSALLKSLKDTCEIKYKDNKTGEYFSKYY